MRRFLKPLSSVLLVVGALLLADAVTTLVWQEPLSAGYARLEQGRLDDRLAKLEGTEPTAVDRRVLSRLGSLDRRLAYASRVLNRRTDDGQPLGRIRMPSIGVTSVIVAGTDTSSLRRGPGHYPDTPLPGAHGTVAIAGHRTTYGAPFRRLDKLSPGDRIEVSMPYGRFVYAVERRRIVPPSATWVTDRVGYDRLVLSACHPLYSAAKRIVVFARLVDTRPRSDRLA
ncbi:MAG TPA: class E sortase [Solirubrobacteraceae bacterium]|nr:class E sortase [Solirubrobacteraceae bacterium]